MAQNPILTLAQCSPAGTTFRVRVTWQYIQEATYFVAVVFDPANAVVAQQVAGGPMGATTATINNVTLSAAVNYTVAVAQSDQSGTPTSAYSQPFNLLQDPLTGLATVNDLSSITVSATLPSAGAPTGMSISLLDASNALLATENVIGTSGVLALASPLDPAESYYLLVSPSSNQGLSTGQNLRANLEMSRPAISAISYDGSNMTVSSSTALPAGTALSGVLYADGNQIQQSSGSNVTVSFVLSNAGLDLSKRYSASLRATLSGNSGPASGLADAVVTAPQFEMAYYDGSHIGGRWTVPPVAPAPTGATIAAVADGTLVGTPVTTTGYAGATSISGITITTSLKLQANSVFGIASGPPSAVELPFTAPVINSVAVNNAKVTVRWSAVAGAPGYRLHLNDSSGASVGFTDCGAASGTLALPVDADDTYSVSVQPFGTGATDAVISGPMSTAATVLLAAPVVTATSFDGATVTVTWATPAQTAGITGYTAVLLHADTLAPTGYSQNAGAGATSCQIAAAALSPDSRLVAAVQARGTNSTGPFGPSVEVLTVKPAITVTDASATSLHVAWTAAAGPAVTGYSVTISDHGSPETHQTFETAGTVLDATNSLTAAQVYVTVKAKGASCSGPESDSVYLFGAKPSFYPQSADGNGIYLIRSASNQPSAGDIVFAFPDVFTSTPATLPSVGIFTLEANSSSSILPYKLTVAANSIAWDFSPAARATLAANFLDFLKKMEMPDGSTVLIKPGALVMVRQSLALGLPLLFSEQLKFMYGFDPDAQTGGYVDLVPGMRLSLDTSIEQIMPPSNNQMGYVPAGTTTFDIQSYALGSSLDIGFNAFLSAMGRPVVPTPLREPNAGGGGGIDLYTASGRQPYFRLLYPSSVHDPKYTGLVNAENLPVILGATTYNGLTAASEQYATQGNFTGLTNIFPFYFRGRSLLTPQVCASLNGQRHWLALGSTVESLIALAGAQPACVNAAVGGFTMRRSVGGLTSNVSATAITTNAVVTNRVRLEYLAATFTPTQPGYFGLPLFCGDDIQLELGA